MSAHPQRPVETLDLFGGRLCLDFVNTVDPRIGEHTQEFFTTYPDLVHWSRHVGLLAENEANHLLQTAERQPIEAARVFEQALVLRETIYRVFLAIARATHPQRSDLDGLTDAYAQAMKHVRLTPTDEGFAWDWIKCEGEEALDVMLWSVIRSAIDLLTSAEVKRVKECPGVRDCGWLFLDTSKNGSRVWCSMQDCGSRVKMRRQYARKRNMHARTPDS